MRLEERDARTDRLIPEPKFERLRFTLSDDLQLGRSSDCAFEISFLMYARRWPCGDGSDGEGKALPPGDVELMHADMPHAG
jgi:hypothetical protein